MVGDEHVENSNEIQTLLYRIFYPNKNNCQENLVKVCLPAKMRRTQSFLIVFSVFLCVLGVIVQFDLFSGESLHTLRVTQNFTFSVNFRVGCAKL